ncbi:uncharacterized protein N7482_002271 [Penicillium canariense]|uniref:Small EDRK-rich factor-like N-terminal domain-containing protein n=1 Tax=Penicillium canariense TaxID=189055 RepID=A0A9W9IF02_9EURO|nr:uncharacterized protein N7482_002271 [Penicillium canariense]KAJ5176394.1 hypothetical protein N7482_002271 [Penicillium canariense]
MTRGNQRDTDRAKAQKKAASAKSKNSLSGTQFQKAKEDAAAIMREKQRKGTSSPSGPSGHLTIPTNLTVVSS